AVRVRRLGGASRDRRGPFRAAGGDHHAREDRGAALDRDGRMGGRGRARHALRRGARGVRRELDPELADHQLPRFLAPLPGRPLHGGGPVLSRRYRRRSRPFGRACSSTRVATPRPGGLDAQRLARPADAMSPPPALEAPTHATSIIYLEDVTVNYDGFKALSRLNFFMERRELRVVIGPNGAGKTTLLDVVSGRVKPESGRVIFGHNTDLLPLRENQIAQLGIGRKFQTPSVFVNLTVWDNVELSLRRASTGVFAALRPGTVLCEGPVEQVQSDPRVLEVYLGRRREGADAVH